MSSRADDLVPSYFGPNDLALAHRGMEASSLVREVHWSLVSSQHIHERDVDYRGYAAVNFDPCSVHSRRSRSNAPGSTTPILL